jgi:hypothetical protein
MCTETHDYERYYASTTLTEISSSKGFLVGAHS